MNYALLLENVWHPPLAFEEVAQTKLPPELELQALWFAGAFGRVFRLKDERKVEIKNFGEWNHGAGPDFDHCAIEIEGVLFKGAIEIDHSASDWEGHGHSTNPAFSNTILHVSFRPKMRESFIRTLHHSQVPELLIGANLLADALNLPTRAVAIAVPGRCFQPLKRIPSGSLERLLREAALFRAKQKAARFLRAAEAHDLDTALFFATVETLGYGGNSLAMKLLAQRVSLAYLRSHSSDAEAILLGTAGFLHADIHRRAPLETQEYLSNLWDKWWKIRPLYESPDRHMSVWQTHGLRPANHPHRRVGGLSTLISSWLEFRKLAFASPFSVKAISDFLHRLGHDFWSFHHTLASAPSSKAISVYGKNLALELCANHLIPLAIHEGRFPYEDYYKLRHSALNQKLKRCAIRLFGSIEDAQPYLRRLAHQQALLQTYHDFCLKDFSQCDDCPFPEQLAQWK